MSAAKIIAGIPLLVNDGDSLKNQCKLERGISWTCVLREIRDEGGLWDNWIQGVNEVGCEPVFLVAVCLSPPLLFSFVR